MPPINNTGRRLEPSPVIRSTTGLTNGTSRKNALPPSRPSVNRRAGPSNTTPGLSPTSRRSTPGSSGPVTPSTPSGPSTRPIVTIPEQAHLKGLSLVDIVDKPTPNGDTGRARAGSDGTAPNAICKDEDTNTKSRAASEPRNNLLHQITVTVSAALGLAVAAILKEMGNSMWAIYEEQPLVIRRLLACLFAALLVIVIYCPQVLKRRRHEADGQAVVAPHEDQRP